MADAIQEVGSWEYKVINALDGGLDVSIRPNMLEESRSPNVLNVIPFKKQVLVDTGYVSFGQVVEGTPRASFQFRKTNGSTELLLLTNTRLYSWDSVALEWHYVGDGADTQANGGEPAGETAILVDDITGFTNGSPIGIELDDGTQHQTTINGAPSGSTITITDAIPVGRTVPDNAEIVQAVVLTGADSIYPSSVTYAAADWFIFTNGVDPPQYYDGTSCQDIPNLPSSGNTKCNAVMLFNEYLFLLGTTEGGTAYPQRVRWCDTADLSEWTTGNASYRDLVETDDQIVCGATLGAYAVIYKQESVFRCEWVGSTDLLFNFVKAIDEDGPMSAGSVVNLGDNHLIFGLKNIYRYQAGMSWQPLADRVYNYVFSSTGNLNRTYRQTAFTTYVAENGEVLFFYPSAASQVPDSCLRYSLEDGSWWIREFADNIRGLGTYQRGGTATWDSVAGTWADQVYPWTSAVLVAGSPTLIFCGDSPKQAYEYNFSAGSDDGTAIQYSIETKDFQQPHFLIRIGMVELYVKGSNILVQYSSNAGVSWSTIATISPGSSLQRVRLHMNQAMRSIRLRLSGSESGFALEWAAIEFCLESEW